MSVKTIIVPVVAADVSRPALETALLLARKSNAHIDALHVRPDPRGLVPYTGEGMDGSMIEEIMDVTEREGSERAVAAKRMFDEFCAERGVRVTDMPGATSDPTIAWQEMSGREDEIVALRGRLYDLIVVGRPLPDSPLPSPITLEAALHDTGRPLLVAPPSAPASVADNVAIAWEASPESARAVGLAIQLMGGVNKVTVLAPNLSPPLALDAAELARWLKWHGMESEVRRFDTAMTEVGPSFLSQAAAVGADLLVKGAYSQSRLRQMVLGGRTRHILNHATIPLLLAK